MSIEFTKIVKGIMLEGVDTDPATTEKGAMWYNTTDKRIKADVGDAGKQEIVTTDEPQNLTNKNITGSTFEVDADTSNVSNLETDNFKAGVIDADPTLAADSDTVIPTQKAVKQFVADSVATKDEASEISYDNTTSGLTATDVQAAVDEVEGRLDTEEQNLALHEADTTTHGTTGDIVGTTDAQDLSNKAIIDPSRLDVYKDTTSNLETYAGTASNGQLCFDTDKKKMYQIIGNKLKAVGSGGATIEVNQTAHGFNQLDAVYFDGSNWVKAKADDKTTTATHIISEVLNVDNFIGMQFGVIDIPSHGKTVGEYYYLSNTTAGDSTTTEPTTGFSCPLFFVPDADRIIAMVYRPLDVENKLKLDDLVDVAASSPSNGDGLVWNNTNSAWETIDIATQSELNDHSSSTATHGVGTIVGLDEVQTLTNKTLTSPDINGGNLTSPKITTPTQLDVKQDSIANLETYATTATNGQLCFATDEKKMFQVVDGELKSVGGASVGDSSIYSFIDADDIADTKWDKSGLTNATFTLDTTTPLAGKKSYLFTSTTTSAGESVSYTIDIPVRSQDSDFHKLKFPYQYNGTKGNVTIEMYDVTNSESINTVEIDPTVNRMDLIFSKPAGCTQVKFIINCVTGEDSVFELDQISISDAAYGYGSTTISETITHTGYDSKNGDLMVLFSTEGKNTSSKLLKVTNTDHTRYTFVKDNVTFIATSNVSSASTIDYSIIKLFDKDGNVKLLSYFDTSATDSGQPKALSGVAEKDDYLVVTFNSGSGDNTPATSFSVTATAQSDKILFEDEREQAHVVASFKLEGNDGREITGGTEDIYFTGTGDGWISNGDSNYYTVQKDNQLLTFQGQIYTTDASNSKYVDMYVNGVRYKRISDTIYTSNIDFSYTGNIGEFSKGDTISLRFGATFTLNNQDWVHYLILREEYLPPLEQASVPTILAVNASEENEYKARVRVVGNTTANPTIINSTDDFINSVLYESDRRYNFDISKLGLTSEPIVSATIECSQGDAVRNANAISVTNTGFQVLVDMSDEVTYDIVVTVTKSGADRSPTKAYCVDGKSVVKKRTMRIRVNTDDYYNKNNGQATTEIAANMESLEGDIFGSLANNIVTIPKGKYELIVPISAYGTTNWVHCKLVNETNNVTIETKNEVSWSNDGNNIMLTNVPFYFTLDDTKDISVKIWSENAGSGIYTGTIVLNKLL